MIRRSSFSGMADTLRRASYRLRYGKFGHLGRGIRISPRATIENPGNLYIGNGSRIEEYCLLRLSGSGEVRIGANCYIGRMTEILDAGGFVHLSDQVQLGGGNFVTGQGGLEIGSAALIAPGVSIVANQHTFSDKDTPIRYQPERSKGIVIGGNGWIGVGATILDGVRVGDHVVIGANSVVTKSVPSYCVVAGVPARILREIE